MWQKKLFTYDRDYRIAGNRHNSSKWPKKNVTQMIDDILHKHITFWVISLK